ncbi:MAG: ABC transporter ATP-binding protein [Candidatus Polarisedimenticolaceae bacterium]|nr:ABC transporter ATP-binding protein [Candidatus Polarisedimenticolaceae bacterium]
MIKTEGLYRYYGNYCAVRNLGLELYPGEVLGLLGPNGAGKSSTLRMLAGNLAPSAGQIWLNGVDLQSDPIQAKRALGYLPENPPLYPELTVDEYLRYCARLHRISGAAVDEAVSDARGRCGLDEVGQRLIGNLSKGYQQRVGIAQAIVHNPMVVILDEPTVGLDPVQIREIRSLICNLGRERGVILSTHILPEVQAICSRVLILHQGEQAYAASLKQGVRPAGGCFLVRLTQAPELAAIMAMPGICSAESLAQGRYRLQTKKDLIASQLAEQLVQAGWGLEEFAPEQPGLEQIFVRITTGEQSG